MKKNNEKITIETLFALAANYVSFSCRPKTVKYKVGDVIDADKSIKWNREEVERRNKAREEKVKELNNKKNGLYIQYRDAVRKYIIQETGVEEKTADKIYTYVYNHYHSYGIGECITQLDELLELFQ